MYDKLCILEEELSHKMVKFYPSSIHIPYPFKKFPKNLMDASHKAQKKFLDNNLSIIEDLHSKNQLSKTFLSWFVSQNNFHKKSGIMNHDGFWKKLSSFIPPHHVLCCGFMTNMNTGAYRGGNIGPDLEALGPFTTETGSTNGQIVATKLNNGAVDDLYDQIAVSIGTISAGNIRLGCYDDSGSTLPDNLYSETGSFASPGSETYTFQSVTEFSLATVLNWVAYQNDSATCRFDRGALSGAARLKVQAFGAFEDPITSTSNNDFTYQLKIGHS